MRKLMGVALGSSVALLYVSGASAQTVVTQPSETTVVAQPPPPVVTQPAQPTTVVTQPAPPQQTVVAVPAARERVTTGGPNTSLLTSGLFTFGIPYGISVVVAAESSRNGDKNLFIPVVGPWLAYGSEGNCDGSTVSCSRSTGTKVLLAADGIFQAIGAIELVAAFAFPDRRTVASSPGERKIMLAPSRMGNGGYGLAAAGTF